MTERVKSALSYFRAREYRQLRKHEFWDLPGFHDLDEYAQSTLFMQEMLSRQKPLLFPDDIFGFNRYLIDRPGVDANSHSIIDGQPFFERYSNITPNFDLIISKGLSSLIDELKEGEMNESGEKQLFCKHARMQLECMSDLADRYRNYAKEIGCKQLYDALSVIPNRKATTFYEALVFLKLLVFTLRCSQYKHLTFGRFDQYMLPYYEASKKAGASVEELLEILELFFISVNMDSDLYPGIQQGDNGQSMVLGGYDADGTCRFNELSELCMQASLDLSLIDPKINLRVNKTTPHSIYALGTKLTKQGLGFPQYLNDDVIIPGLIKLGYRPKDAADYAVAACWEPIIPGYGADIPNEIIFSYPMVLFSAIQSLKHCDSIDVLLEAFDNATRIRCEEIISKYNAKELYYFRRPLPVSPLISLMMNGCLESRTDIGRFGARYYNCGAFGAGLSTAADSINAIQTVVFSEKSCSWEQLQDALNRNYDGYEQLQAKLKQCSKMGSDNENVNKYATAMMESYVRHLNGKPNGTGGVWRCGTGSAQHYIHDAAKCPASADGRKAGEPYACSFSPAPGAKTNGPLSVIRAFTSMDLTNTVNGGPLTMELHHNIFRNPEGEKKVAELVQLFILCGGHQLQLNMLNRDTLLDALAHPEEHRDLVVRVWGWSGYFCELSPEFQNHILSRTQYTL